MLAFVACEIEYIYTLMVSVESSQCLLAIYNNITASLIESTMWLLWIAFRLN